MSAYVRYRADDFETDVAPSQPLLGTGLAEQNATSPGGQLGLLPPNHQFAFLEPGYRFWIRS